jgi:hypothetical protein
MLLHAMNNIILSVFWPNHFTNAFATDRIFQDVALLPFLTLPLTNPHPLTHSLHFAALAKLCPDDTVASTLGPLSLSYEVVTVHCSENNSLIRCKLLL